MAGVSPARYATFTNRSRALLIDSALVVGAFMVMFLLGEFGDGIPGAGRIAWLLMVIVIFYEPLFVWRRGATIGHSAKHLRVVSTATGKPPGFGRALARYLIKGIFGLPSFVTIVLSRKHQAVHDMLTKTTVQLSAAADPDVDDYHLEGVEELDVELPSRSRRFVAMAIYLVALFLGYGVGLGVIDPQGCSQSRTCSANSRDAIHALGLLWLGLSAGVIVAGWKGFLLGARRVAHVNSDSLVA